MLVGAVPPRRHIFNMINDINIMDRQGRRSPPVASVGAWDNVRIFSRRYTHVLPDR
ncbi:hypothetical protein Desti_3850 [Desulfomonile tiedjei DSM 6799]|uniref:Uncharacterized protein n=1 Tax=Desulfomonile tiedjei (strain ATCC 49306 / DSM 6799 / DCB-1) TaxID=706587 RepID=I4CAA1_DESTA|nr:hypothetical protein Desti_3850 [Desulfomonile tiedjei DSM 6799]